MTSPAADTAAGSLGISLVTYHPDLTLLQRTLASLRVALATLQHHRPPRKRCLPSSITAVTQIASRNWCSKHSCKP
jgi:hypothetical protein